MEALNIPMLLAENARLPKRPTPKPIRLPDEMGNTLRFDLPNAPAAFRSALWEAEFSPRGIARLNLLPESNTHHDTNGARVSSAYTKTASSVKRLLLERLKGGRGDFDWADFDLEGTGDFHRRVWKAMRAIPFGETATYADVARDAGSPLAFRACGQACGANRIIVFIPCHRVVSANGLGGFGCGLEWKKHFLAMEKK